MKKHTILPILLTRFDGGAAAAAAPSSSAAVGTKGGTQSAPASTRQAETGEDKIVYGKQPPEETKPANAPNTAIGSDAGNQQEDRSAKFKELISGTYKDLYDQEVQKIISKRFKDVKSKDETLNAQKPILDALAARYGVSDGDLEGLQNAIDHDDAMWERQADEAGMSVEQYRKVQKLQMENERLRTQQNDLYAQQRQEQQIQQWISQAEELKSDPAFAEFDLQREVDSNPQFLSMLKVGIPIRNAYGALHLDAVTGHVAQAAAAQQERAVTANIRARGSRPAENGASSQSGTVYKPDPKTWTREEFNNVLKLVEQGKKIYL